MRRLFAFALALVAAVPARAQDEARAPVDITAPPFQAIGQVNVPGNGRCTGVLVARRLAATAAHCLYDRRNARLAPPSSIHFVLGYDRGDYVSVSVAEALVLDPAHVPGRSAEALGHDWALLRLAEPAPDAIAPMRLAAEASRLGSPVTAAGFGRERAHMLTAARDCRHRGLSAEGLVVAECAVIPGYSGGPLIDEAGHLSGIIVAAAVRDGVALAVAVPVATFAARIE